MVSKQRKGKGGARVGNVANRTIFTRDNLEVMRGMDSGVVDLIYLDPPFNKKKQFQAPIGSEAEGASFKDWWVMDDVKFEDMELLERKHPHITALIRASGAVGERSNTPYLLYMAPRLIEMRRILKDTGSIYLHCDPTISHSLKLLMDAVFGVENFRNEIVWEYGLGGSSQRAFSKKHDLIFFYSCSDNYQFTKPQIEATSAMLRGKMKGMKDVWSDIPSLNNMAKERVGYPAQKPLELIERIISASSSRNEFVLDPFCGCATTCVAAEKLGRQWIGIDVSPKTAELAAIRMERELGKLLPLIHRFDAPKRRTTTFNCSAKPAIP